MLTLLTLPYYLLNPLIATVGATEPEILDSEIRGPRLCHRSSSLVARDLRTLDALGGRRKKLISLRDSRRGNSRLRVPRLRGPEALRLWKKSNRKAGSQTIAACLIVFKMRGGTPHVLRTLAPELGREIDFCPPPFLARPLILCTYPVPVKNTHFS